ncbi:MAG: DUF1826 domain-containing protein [Alphaproteobacteria bacterium]|nr:DUF1826 domain-containing protein [Alphaproteobacteria bacterium]
MPDAQALTPVVAAADGWSALRRPDCPLAIERRDLGALAAIAKRLAARAPFERSAEGPPDAAVAGLGRLPPALRADIAALAARFAAFMAAPAVRIRLEGVVTDACRKIHADFTDVRLITTYAGPGTDYVPAGCAPDEAALLRLDPGDIGLFKGRLYGRGHAPCLHRSPPLGDSGETRLVLVIDTPFDPDRLPVLSPPAI